LRSSAAAKPQAATEQLDGRCKLDMRVRLKPSPLLALSLTAVHLAAGVTLIPLELPPALRATVAAAVAASLVRSLWLYTLLRAKLSVIAIDIEDQECCTIYTRNGDVHTARILGTTYVSSIFTVINVRMSVFRLARHILLATDSTSPEQFRQVRVLLRWGRRRRGEEVVALRLR
jgi:hypothetical protein